MMDKDENGDSAFSSAIQCASSIMMNKIISENTSDFLGVMLIGTVNHTYTYIFSTNKLLLVTFNNEFSN